MVQAAIRHADAPTSVGTLAYQSLDCVAATLSVVHRVGVDDGLVLASFPHQHTSLLSLSVLVATNHADEWGSAAMARAECLRDNVDDGLRHMVRPWNHLAPLDRFLFAFCTYNYAIHFNMHNTMI